MGEKVTKLILDGEEFSFSEDGKHIKGKKKEYSEEEEFYSEIGKNFPFIIVPREVAKDGIVYGFSDEEKMENWLEERNMLEKHKIREELTKKIRKERSAEELEKIKQYQVKQVKKDTENHKKFMEKHNLKTGQIEEMDEILKDYDPHFKQMSRSCYLYDYVNYRGTVLKLRGADYCVGDRSARCYINLGHFNFDNRANSVKFNCQSWAKLYAGIKYGEPHLDVYGNMADLNFWNWFVYSKWRNSISSVIVFTRS